MNQMEAKNNEMDQNDLNALLHDCLLRVLPLFPLATMKKVSLLISNPSRISSVKLTPDEVELVCTSLRKEMEKLEFISDSVSNSNMRNLNQARVKDLEVSTSISTALEYAKDLRQTLETAVSFKALHQSEISRDFFKTEEVVRIRTDSAEKKIASLQRNLEYLSKVSEKMDAVISQQTNVANEEIARVEQEIMKYEAIPDLEDYLKEYNSLVKSIEALEKMKK